MKSLEYSRQLQVDSDPETLYRWHDRPGAFERLGPPWESVELDGPAAPITTGAKQVAVVDIGPVKIRWHSQISSVTPGKEFQDVQLSGPFAAWEHTHSVNPGSSSGAILEDRILYKLPLGPLGSMVAGGFVRQKLDRMFTYRHRITLQDLARHEAVGHRVMDVLISGASGMVGKALTAFLTTGGHRVRRLVRRKPHNADEFSWNPESGELDAAALDGVDAVVHLAGENIAGRRWSAAQKEKILKSRVDSTRMLVDAINALENKPKVFISAAAVGIYGDRGNEELDETSSHGSGFLSDVCKAWEAEANKLDDVRAVQLRFGVILSAAGGALAKMLLPFKLGAGGNIAGGKQYMSWVALDDAVGAVHHALFTENLSGPVNVVAPQAVTNAEYTVTLGRVLKRPTIFPMPGFAARLAFGELADELLIAGQRVLPSKLQETDYKFEQPELEGALRHQLGR